MFPNLLATSLSPPKNPLSPRTRGGHAEARTQSSLRREPRTSPLVSPLLRSLLLLLLLLVLLLLFLPLEKRSRKIVRRRDKQSKSNRDTIRSRGTKEQRRERERERNSERERERKKSEERKHAERKGTRPYGELVPESTATLNYNQSATDFY